jgi:DNA-binding FadR family transcriptional regulator
VSTLREALAGLGSGDFGERVAADLDFHLLLCRLSGNTMLVDAWRALEGRIRVTIMAGDAEGSPVMMAGDRHAPIVDAIERGEIETAVAVVEQHMSAAADYFAPDDDRS